MAHGVRHSATPVCATRGKQLKSVLAQQKQCGAGLGLPIPFACGRFRSLGKQPACGVVRSRDSLHTPRAVARHVGDNCPQYLARRIKISPGQTFSYIAKPRGRNVTVTNCS